MMGTCAEVMARGGFQEWNGRISQEAKLTGLGDELGLKMREGAISKVTTGVWLLCLNSQYISSIEDMLEINC